jgi:hypothetical protein
MAVSDRRGGDWTIETAIAYLKELIESNDRRYEERHAASQKALELGLGAAEKRFEGVNEFRQTLADQQRMLIPRAEAEAMFRSLTEKIERIEKQSDASAATRGGVKAGWGYAVGAVGLVAAVVSLIALFGT